MQRRRRRLGCLPQPAPLPADFPASLPACCKPARPAACGCSVRFAKGSLASSKVSTLTFLLSAYALNGTWLGYTTWTTQFQLCGTPNDDGSRWSRCGRV